MSQENVEIVRRHVDAYNRRDLLTLLALWRFDAEVEVENGQITRLRMFQEHAEALQAVALSEQDAHADS